MKLELRGHDERYVVEQSLMNLFPGEKPVYEPIGPGEDNWAVITVDDAPGLCRVTVELNHQGKTASQHLDAPLSGTDFEQEGQRRHAIGRCFFLAARAVTGDTPPWGMLTGVRPDKPVTSRAARKKQRAMAWRRWPSFSKSVPERGAVRVREADLPPKASSTVMRQPSASSARVTTAQSSSPGQMGS